MRYEIQSEAGDGINGTIYSTENAAIAAVKAHFGEECSVISSKGSGDPDGSGDSLTMSDDDDTEVADIVTIPECSANPCEDVIADREATI